MTPIKIIDVPFELGAGTVGASLGPEALKAAASEVDSELFTRANMVKLDFGDNFLVDDSPYTWAKYIPRIRQTLHEIAREVSKTLGEHEFPMVLAGDHSTAAGTIAGILQRFPNEKLGVIWIDAHADLHSPFTSPSGNVHGMTLAIASGTDNVERKRRNLDAKTIEQWTWMKDVMQDHQISLEDIIYIGGRDIEEEEQHLINEFGIQTYSVDEYRSSPDQVIDSIFANLDHCDRIYVSFDVDSMDPSISNGTGTPVKGGLTGDEARSLNEKLVKNEKICVWEIVEINPLLDCNNKMAKVCLPIVESVYDAIKNR